MEDNEMYYRDKQTIEAFEEQFNQACDVCECCNSCNMGESAQWDGNPPDENGYFRFIITCSCDEELEHEQEYQEWLEAEKFLRLCDV